MLTLRTWLKNVDWLYIWIIACMTDYFITYWTAYKLNIPIAEYELNPLVTFDIQGFIARIIVIFIVVYGVKVSRQKDFLQKQLAMVALLSNGVILFYHSFLITRFLVW